MGLAQVSNTDQLFDYPVGIHIIFVFWICHAEVCCVKTKNIFISESQEAERINPELLHKEENNVSAQSECFSTTNIILTEEKRLQVIQYNRLCEYIFLG